MQTLHRGQLGGIGDEAAVEANRQIAVHQELGLGFVELRNVDGRAVAELSPESARQLAAQIHQAGLRVGGLASRIGNWARPINHPFEVDLEELESLAQLAPLFGTDAIRVMSYPNTDLSAAEWERQVLARYRVLTARARDYGLKLRLENCAGWVRTNPQHFLQLQAEVGADVVGCLFDIGNPVAYGYDGFSYLEAVWSQVVHVHVKDGRRDGDNTVFTLPGEGDAEVLRCLDFLLERGYRGDVSFEPHLAMIPHLGVQGNPEELLSSYRAYAQAFMALCGERLQGPLPA